MILYSLITVVTVVLGFMVTNTISDSDYNTRQQLLNRICIAAIFAVLFLTCALRVGVGNDYITYIQNAHEIYVGGITVTEWGYNLVVKMLYVLSGSENYLLLFGFFGFWTILIFMKAMYDQSCDFAVSFLLFMTLGIYFRSFNTVRYYLVLAITLYSLRYVVKKEYVKFILLILLAALFHKSVLVVIPLYIICNRIWPKWFYAIVGVLTVLMYILKEPIMRLALVLYPSYKDTIYLTEGVGLRENLFSIGRCVLVLVMVILCYKESVKDNKEAHLYVNMNITAIALYIGGSFLPLVSRFGYYLITAQILLIPKLLQGLKGKKKKYLTMAVVACAVLYFCYFLKVASGAGIAVLPYKSWLFDEVDWNNVEEKLIYTNR